MVFRVLHHNNCFDGACSASLFTRVHRECLGGADAYLYKGLVHRAGALFEESDFDADQTAIVDFKYSPSPRLTWWFDHHQSAFADDAERAHFEQMQKDQANAPHRFFDPAAPSCTGLIARVAAERFGFDTSHVAELIHWADIIDAARFPSAEDAVAAAEPAMQLTMIIEAASDPKTILQLIPLLASQPLQNTLEAPFVQTLLGPLLEKHQRDIALFRSRVAVDRGVITFDLMDQTVEGYNKFIPYFLLPEGVYHVGLSRSSYRCKISVGTNPWTTIPPAHLANIAAICERFGGGGHARVGAVSMPAGDIDAARAAAATIAEELKQMPRE